jgi:hypothetical protein
METEEKDVQVQDSNEQEEEVLETSSEETNDEEQDSTDWKAIALKNEQLANNQKIRAEKAEGKLKQVRPEVTQSKSKGDLGSKDLYALMEAKVPQDDIDEVIDYAKFKGVSIQEALKTSFVKATLSEKAEQRRIAESTNVGGARRSTQKVSVDTIMSKAQNGEMPDSDEDMMALIKARKGIK